MMFIETSAKEKIGVKYAKDLNFAFITILNIHVKFVRVVQCALII